MPHPYQQIEEQLKNIPEDLQQAISSVDVANKIEEIAKKNGLQLDETDELIDETGLVMLGLTHPNEYLGNLKKRIGVPSEVLQKIVREIDEQVFINIRMSLREIHEKKEIQTPVRQGVELNREDILKGIENPLPEEKNKIVAPETNQVKQVNLTEEKLKTPLSIPQDIIDVEDKKPSTREIPQKRWVDPYKEPLE